MMERDPLALFARLNAKFRQGLQKSQAFRDLGLPEYSALVLGLVARFPDWTQQDLAEATGRDKAQVTRALKDLEKRLLIARGAHASDWRARSAVLTEAGRSAVDQLDRQRKLLSLQMLSPLDPEELETTCRVVERMLEALGEDQADNGKPT